MPNGGGSGGCVCNLRAGTGCLSVHPLSSLLQICPTSFSPTSMGCRVFCLLARKMKMQISDRIPGQRERLKVYLKTVMALNVFDAVS